MHCTIYLLRCNMCFSVSVFVFAARSQRSPVIINLAFAHSRSFASTPIVVLALLCSALLALLSGLTTSKQKINPWHTWPASIDASMSFGSNDNEHPCSWINTKYMTCYFLFHSVCTVTSGIWMSRTKLKLDVPLSAIGSRLDSIETIWSGTMLVWGQS